MPPVIAEALHQIEVPGGVIGVFSSRRISVFLRMGDGLGVADHIGQAAVARLGAAQRVHAVILLPGAVIVEAVFQHALQRVDIGDFGSRLNTAAERIIGVAAVEGFRRRLREHQRIVVGDDGVVELVPIGLGLHIGRIADLGVRQPIEVLNPRIRPGPIALARHWIGDVEGHALLAVLAHETERIFVRGVGCQADASIDVPVMDLRVLAKAPPLRGRRVVAFGQHPALEFAPRAADLGVIEIALRADVAIGFRPFIGSIPTEFEAGAKFRLEFLADGATRD